MMNLFGGVIVILVIVTWAYRRARRDKELIMEKGQLKFYF